MTPEPPPSSQSPSLPPRSRPNLGDFVKDGSEMDLWAFDDIDSPEAVVKKGPPRPESIPIPRDPGRKLETEASRPIFKTGENSGNIRVNAGGVRPKLERDVRLSAPVCKASLDSVENWNDPTDHPLVALGTTKSPTEAVPSASQAPVAVEVPVTETAAVAIESAPQVVEESAPVNKSQSKLSNENDEFSPIMREGAVPVSLVPNLKLSKIERLGLWSLLIILVVCGGFVGVKVVLGLAAESKLTRSSDFPIKGNQIEILSADTFWREPITSGAKMETFRRGTVLVPVVDLLSKGKPAAVRVFFRDENGMVIGDSVTRAIIPGVLLQVASTAGFDDVGMHAAYRTGQTQAWSIEVREASSVTAANEEFKKLIEIPISTVRR